MVQNTDPVMNVTHKNSLLYNTGANVIPYRHDKLLYGLNYFICLIIFIGNRLGIKQQCTHMWATATYLLGINNINMF